MSPASLSGSTTGRAEEQPGAKPTAVVALGGNALSPAGERSTIHDQFRHTRASLGPVVDLAIDGWNVVIVHGNGPQVGDALVRNEVARAEVAPLPLGVLVAATAGWIGYMIQQSVYEAIQRSGHTRPVATVITQVLVDENDPALANPTKFIGHALPPERAAALAREGVTIRTDSNGRQRRVVGSPAPLSIHEVALIRRLAESGTIVIACGGGGVPVYLDRRFGLEGVDAVVDKDLAAAVLARELDARLLLILTDVDAVYEHWGTQQQRALDKLTVAEAQRLDASGALGEGSMAPKVRAAVDYVRRTGGRAVIAELARGRAAVRGETGTEIISG
ncbi:MAG TPA: carbamate kinase [Gemmatimonadaceae bacterium]|nr:carbamate kinase [Gemmatimonadaceae bacterium]